MFATAFLLALPVQPTDVEAHWLRYAAISPDGAHVAFSYAGDLWLASTERTAGKRVEAQLLTTHVGYETRPVWAADSRRIAFAADWHGQLDLFLTTIDRAPAQRLTFHSAADIPTSFSPDGEELWFTSSRQDTAASRLGSTMLSELYAIDVGGGAPRRLLTTPAEAAQPDSSGRSVLYQDLKAYENEWRKHHVSSHARDLWSWNPESGEHTQLTTYRGEDRNPVWLPDGKVAFLSERSGTFNVWIGEADNLAEARQVTDHELHPVRFLSAADDGTLAYTFNGDIYTVTTDGQSQHLPIVAHVDQRTNTLEHETIRQGATEMVVSPDEDEVAFVIRGEVFVASIDHGTTKRVTQTPEQERSVTWGEDGRTLYYASERGGSWNLYATSIQRPEELNFHAATVLAEEVLLAGDEEMFQPVVSPDGASLAFLLDRDAIHVLDLETKQHRPVVPAEWNYSYSDGDMSFAWSPDSQWLTFAYSPYQRLTKDTGIVNVASGEIHNVSDSGYEEGVSEFSPGGDMIIYASSRFGQREHSGRGGQSDVMGVYLTQAAFDEAALTWEEHERLKEEREKNEAKDETEELDGSDEPEGEDDAEAEAEETTPEPLNVETDGFDERLRRLTMQSAPIGDIAITPDSEALIYLAEVDGKWDLWTSHLRDRKTQRLLALGDEQPGGELHLFADGKTLIVRTAGGQLRKVKLTAGKHGLPETAKPEPIAFAAEMTIDGPAERAHIFDHAWRQVREKFYVADLHGVDWDGMKDNYRPLLEHVHNGYDFAELLSEMLGELNASHTGGSFRPSGLDRDDTASLGLIYGELTDAGLAIDEVLAGGPCDRAESKLEPGVRITAIDGAPLTPSENPWRLLDRKSQKPILLSCTAPDGTTFDEVAKPIPSRRERGLFYDRWIERSEALVAELSGGRIGYVHVRGMNDGSYREVYSQVLGRNSDKEALIVDTRWNGGGWLHDQLVTFLGGDDYCTFVPRGKEPGRYGGEPSSRWSRPVCVVQNEGNYSDAHFFPYSFRALGLGKLIGTPVAGTSTAVWWETCFDGQTVFGIPELGVQDRDGNYLENQELFPDIEVYNDPASVEAGRDKQIEAAVRAMLETLDPEESSSEGQ